MPDDIKLRLPGASVSHPSCGACHEETDHDGDEFYCDGCRLGYSSSDPESPGYYRDDEDVPCGAIAKDPPYVSLHEKTNTWYRHVKYPCPLPTGHKDTGSWWDGNHFHPSEAIETTKPADAEI